MAIRKKLCIVVSGLDKALSFEWLALALKDDYNLSYILLNAGGSEFEEFLIREKIKFNRITYTGNRDLAGAFFKVLRIFITNKPDIIHANYFAAQLVSLLAGWLAGVNVRIYTRHHSNYHHDYFPGAVKYDRLCNWLATRIISISQATDKVLIELEHVAADKIVKIYHGLKFDNLLDVNAERIAVVRKKWNIPPAKKIIGVIARYEEYKGYQYIIPAFKEYLITNPNAVLVIANAKGPYQNEVVRLLHNLPAESYILIPFEADIVALYYTFNIYIHVPVNATCEAFGQTYMEALAIGIPSIFTLSGISKEFIADGYNAVAVGYESSEDILEALLKITSDKTFADHIVENGKKDVYKLFDLKQQVDKLNAVYQS